MIKVTEKDIGRGVFYKPINNYGEKVYGVITSFNDSFVFVRYKNQNQTQGGIATERRYLEYERG